MAAAALTALLAGSHAGAGDPPAAHPPSLKTGEPATRSRQAESAVASVPVRRLTSPTTGRIPPSVATLLDTTPATGYAEALVELSEQVDLDALMSRFDAGRVSKAERRSQTIAALEQVAARRRPLEQWLDARLAEGAVDLWRGFAIVNRLYVSARPAVLRELAARDDVAFLKPVRPDPAEATGPVPPSPDASESHPAAGAPVAPSAVSWALDSLGARAAWKAGWTGRGIVVGSLDTGVLGSHVVLRGNHRSERGWIDPLAGRLEPWDDHGHGTETMACAVGRGSAPGEIGVAPGASWIAARTNPLNRFNAHGLTAGADWMLREGRPDVLLCAWGHGPSRCETGDLPLLKALRLAEIVVVLPSGNSGPQTGTGETPAALPPLFPGDIPPLSVAATEAGGAVFERSSRGPSPCAGAERFPWISAPGSGVRVATYSSPTSFDLGSGTSLSAGYVAGAAALVLQRCPSLTVRQVSEVLAETATDIAPPGFDTSTGWGLLNLPSALERAGLLCNVAPKVLESSESPASGRFAPAGKKPSAQALDR